MDILPDWKRAVEVLDEFYASFCNRRKTAPSIIADCKAAAGTFGLEERLFRWVRDSLEYVDSRYCYDFDGTFDDKIRDRKATGVEKALILKTLYNDIDKPCVLLLAVPSNYSPTLTKLPTLAQFQTYLLLATIGDSAVFLDPTSSEIPFGQYPWYLDGVHALRVDTDYPEFTMLPERKRQNLINWSARCRIDTTLTLQGTGGLTLTNQYSLQHRENLSGSDTSAVAEELTDNFMGVCDAKDIIVVEEDTAAADDTTFVVSVEWTKPMYGESDAGDILFSPNCINRIPADLIPVDSLREADYYFSFSRNIQVRIHYELPDGYSLVNAPRPVTEYNPDVGLSYRAEIVSDENGSGFTYQRIFQRKYARLKKTATDQLRTFYEAIAHHDQQTVLIRHADSAPKP